jgi:hypothetical protein
MALAILVAIYSINFVTGRYKRYVGFLLVISGLLAFGGLEIAISSKGMDSFLGMSDPFIRAWSHGVLTGFAFFWGFRRGEFLRNAPLSLRDSDSERT